MSEQPDAILNYDTVAFTAAESGVSLLLPVGLVPIDGGPGADSYIHIDALGTSDDADDDYDPERYRTITVRRWHTGLPHAPSADLVSLMTLHDAPLSDDWTGTPQTTSVDGAPALTRPFRDHDGIIGTVTTCDLGDTIVTFRATWHPHDLSAPGEFARTVTTARLLTIDDLVIDKASAYHPLVGVSIEVPLGWHLGVDDDTLTIQQDTSIVAITRTTAPREHPFDGDPIKIAPPLTMAIERSDESSLIASSNGLEPVHITASGLDERTRPIVISLIGSIRTHPR